MGRNIHTVRVIAIGAALSVSFGVAAGCSGDDEDDMTTETGGTSTGGLPVVDDTTDGVDQFTGGTGGIPTTGGTGGTGGETAMGGMNMGGTGGMNMGGMSMGGMGGMPNPDIADAVVFIDNLQLGSTDEATFDADAEGWSFGLDSEATATWVSDGGEDGGGVKLEMPFEQYDQQRIVQKEYDSLQEDWSGSLVTMRVNLDSGLVTTASNSGQVRLVVQTTDSFVFGNGAWVQLDTVGTWVTVSMDLSEPEFADTGWDATEVKAVALEFATGTAP